MRFLSMLIKNIAWFIRKQSLIFMIMALGLTVSFWALIFLHMDSVEGYKHRDESTMREYKMFFNTADIKSVAALVDDMVNSSTLPHIEKLNIHTYIKDGNYILTGFYGSNIRANYAIEVGSSFQEKPAVKNPALVSNVLLKPDDFLNLEKARFKIMGQDFQVIGAGLFAPSYEVKNAPDPLRQVIIPYSNFREIASDCSMVVLDFEHILSSEEASFLASEFNRCFPNEELAVPIPGEEKYARDIYVTLLIITLGVGLSLVNIIAMFRYWIERNWKKYYTYRLCGASGIWIYGLIACELMIVSMASFFAALLIYSLLMPVIMTDDYMYYQLNLFKTLILLGISMLATFVIVHPTAKKIAQMMPQEVKPV